eukprot:302447_1
MSPFKIKNIIQVTSANGKSGAEFKMNVTKDPPSAKVNISCRIVFLGQWFSTNIEINTPEQYYFEFKYHLNLVSSTYETTMLVKTVTDTETFQIKFSLHEEQKQHGRAHVISQLRQAIKNMEKDDKDFVNDLNNAIKAYHQLFTDLTHGLKKANKQFSLFSKEITNDLNAEQRHWQRLVNTATTEISTIKTELSQGNDNAAKDLKNFTNSQNQHLTNLRKSVKKINIELKTEAETLTNNQKTINDEISSQKQKSDTDIQD